MQKYQVIIPEWQNHYVKSKSTKAKYWKWSHKEKLPLKFKNVLRDTPIVINQEAYCSDHEGNRFIKNSGKVGKSNIWIINGQSLYSGTMNWRLRKSIALYFHEYFSKYIKEQLSVASISSILVHNYYLSISCDIYEIKRGNMPDIDNMWPLEKFFSDALTDCGVILDDGPDVVIESGRKKYHWVKKPEDRKLVFTIKIIK